MWATDGGSSTFLKVEGKEQGAGGGQNSRIWRKRVGDVLEVGVGTTMNRMLKEKKVPKNPGS